MGKSLTLAALGVAALVLAMSAPAWANFTLFQETHSLGRSRNPMLGCPPRVSTRICVPCPPRRSASCRWVRPRATGRRACSA